MTKLRPFALLLVLALGACTSGALSASKSRPSASITPTPTLEPVVEGTDPGDGAEIPRLSSMNVHTPNWPSVRSHVGGLPVPRGWRLIERKADGYLLDETYESPAGVTYEQVLAWYLERFPTEIHWGGWRPCAPGGNGDAGMYAEPEWWAWRNPHNIHHSIQIGLGGSPHGERVAVSLQRNNWGEECFE